MKKPLPLTYLLVALVLMVCLHFVLPLKTIVPFPFNLLGVIPCAFGIALNLAADRAFTRKGTTVKPYQVSTALVTTGVFGLSRHPMYLGFTFVLLGLAIFMGVLSPFAVVVVFPPLMEVVFIRVEEGMLDERFGAEWRAYKARVHRWL
jgi:protein-S-isoprenylcysteine O-methyltransferase Ste14